MTPCKHDNETGYCYTHEGECAKETAKAIFKELEVCCTKDCLREPLCENYQRIKEKFLG